VHGGTSTAREVVQGNWCVFTSVPFFDEFRC
jgi:hypothetical protein